ncbi:hypothetical protein [Spirillospora sp. NPDC047279]|uniref:hypothetical protein n=1 Tax=Spirillospora sp. NPDC047279 TaxID=3155478 RepID=UPI0033E2D658
MTLSWLGVRDVVRTAVSGRSAPPPIAGPVIHSSPSDPPGPSTVGTPTARPEPTGTPSPTPSPDTTPAPERSPSPSGPADPEAAESGDVRSYATRGGRAAMAMDGDKVRLVSAISNPGFETRVTPAEGWLRVDFMGADHTSSVIATWYEHDPIVRVYEY